MCACAVPAHTAAELGAQLGGAPRSTSFRHFQNHHVVAPRLHRVARRVVDRGQGGSTWQKKIVALLPWIE